ncbi:unnamed protein product [Durusdinium trenchii]|uniref:RING-type domain-containing protein n=1 Tax=Durusdinium trenchii TaxID=1381693 RepID=A0ABP0PSX4_9DINO
MDGERTCLICSREICSPDSAAHILPCSHAQWHESCIHQWLTRQRTCPLCRTPSQVAVVEEPPTAIGMAQDLLGRMQDLLDEEVQALKRKYQALQLEADLLEQELEKELVQVCCQDAAVDLEARALLARLTAALRRQGVAPGRLFAALSPQKAPLALEAAETALAIFGGSASAAHVNRAARLMDLNGSGWIEEADFQEAMERF